MKFLMKKLSFAIAGLLILASCEKVENKVVLEGGTAPVLTASMPVNSTLQLDAGTKSNTAVELQWSNPDYTFNTGVSSLDVNYTIQVDKAGAAFSSPNLQEKSLSRETSLSLTQGDINKMLIQLGFPFDQEATFEVRLKSYLGDGSAPLYSNVLTYKASPYLDVVVALPSSGELYIVGGDAKLGVWSNGGSFAVQNQKFNRDDLTTFSITVDLSGGDNTTDKNQFLFVPVWGDWSHKFACKKTAEQPTTGGSFGLDLSDNFPGPPEAGTYKIVVDFVLGKYTVTKL